MISLGGARDRNWEGRDGVAPSYPLFYKQVPEDSGAVIVVFIVILDETPPIDINNIAFPVGAEEVEAADTLAKGQGDFPRDFPLIGA